MTQKDLSAQATPSSATSRSTAAPKLSGRMGVPALMLTVLAFSAPIAAVAGYIPFTIMFGGEAAALIFVAATLALLMFAIGYVAMTKSLPATGSFYAFISAGLGKVTGLGGAFLAVASYLLMLAGVFVFIGLTATELIESIGGPHTPWWLWGALSWVLVSVVGYFNIELSAKVLSIVMVIEVVIVVTFNVAVLFNGGGPEGFTFRPVNPAALMEGDFGVGILFAVMIFLGFESTALFRDEVRDPDKTIPRATYGAVLTVGILYVVSSFLLVTYYGSSSVDVATANPKGMFPDAIGELVLPVFAQITMILIVTSELAAGIAVHNVVSRYLFNLGADRALPSSLSRVHPRHLSPARASVVVAALVAIILIPLGLGNLSGIGLDAQLFGLGTVGVFVLLILVSLAVIFWFARGGVPVGTTRFARYVAPSIAIAILLPTLILAVMRFDLVVGGAPGQNLVLLGVLAAMLAIGIGVALYFRSRKPDIFAALGRADSGQSDHPAPVDTAH